MTLAEWAELGEDSPGELVDGLLVEDEEVGAEHDIVGAWLIWLLQSWLGARGFVDALWAHVDRLSPTESPEG